MGSRDAQFLIVCGNLRIAENGVGVDHVDADAEGGELDGGDFSELVGGGGLSAAVVERQTRFEGSSTAPRVGFTTRTRGFRFPEGEDLRFTHILEALWFIAGLGAVSVP